MNQQQETLNKEIEIPGILIASISRSIGKYLTNYKIYLKLDVVVKRGWSKDEKIIKKLIGY